MEKKEKLLYELLLYELLAFINQDGGRSIDALGYEDSMNRALFEVERLRHENAGLLNTVNSLLPDGAQLVRDSVEIIGGGRA